MRGKRQSGFRKQRHRQFTIHRSADLKNNLRALNKIRLKRESRVSPFESIRLTINVLGDGSEMGCFRGKEFELFSGLMEGKEYINYGDANMTVRGTAFTKEEFLKWLKVWLIDKGFYVDELIEAPIEDFAGTNQHACAVAECRAMKAELDALDPSEWNKRVVRDLRGKPKKEEQ